MKYKVNYKGYGCGYEHLQEVQASETILSDEAIEIISGSEIKLFIIPEMYRDDAEEVYYYSICRYEEITEAGSIEELDEAIKEIGKAFNEMWEE